MKDALGILLEPGSVAELRILTSRRGVASGYFDDRAKLAEAAARWDGKVPGVYATLNPVNPALLSRASNRVIEYAKHATSDADVTCRRWFPLDFDPIRPSGISSTDDEHAAALALARMVRDWLAGDGWPDPLLSDSGNGAHLLYRVELPNTPEATRLVTACLKALAFRFSDERVEIDLTVGNAARIWKVPGTMACKGESTTDRPHRRSQLLEQPDRCVNVPTDLLEALATQAPTVGDNNGHRGVCADRMDVEGWIRKHQLPVVSTGPWRGGERWILNPCPWNDEHDNRSAYVIQFPTGAIAAGCHHNGCSGNDWSALRKLYEPALPAHAYGQADRGDFEQKGRNGASGGHSETSSGALQPLSVLPAADFLSHDFPAATNILAGGNLTRGGKLEIAGTGGIGKSLIAITLGIGLAARRTVLSAFSVTAPQRVGLFLCEDPAGITQDRLKRQLQGMGLSEPPDGLFVFPRDEPLLFGGRQGKLQEAIDRLIETVRRHALSVVIFDPLVAIHEAEENSNTEMARWLIPFGEALQREGCAVVLTHHTTWGQDGEAHSRGASAIQNWADTVWLLRRIETGGREAVKMTVAKINFGTRWDPLILTLDPDSLLFRAESEQGALCSVPALLDWFRDEHNGVFRGKKGDIYTQVQERFGCGLRTAREAFRLALAHQPPLLKDLGRGSGFEVIA